MNETMQAILTIKRRKNGGGIGHIRLMKADGFRQLGALIADDGQSSSQSNWNASPSPKAKGTNVPRPVI